MIGRAEGQILWGQWHRASGDSTQAAHHAAQALADATAPRQPLALLAAHRLLGEIATDAGRFTDAADHLDAALVLATACAVPYERALTLLALASLQAATGNRTKAAITLQTARAIGISLGAMPLLDAAETLAASLASDTTSPPPYPCGLTAREVEILHLVAEGLTDSQIAERLFLSRRTVGAHLGSVYSKLGVASRAAATRFALAHHLGE